MWEFENRQSYMRVNNPRHESRRFQPKLQSTHKLMEKPEPPKTKAQIAGELLKEEERVIKALQNFDKATHVDRPMLIEQGIKLRTWINLLQS